jgi:cation diffusion facilitator CzcD-associated flavoprotein CzcO
MASPASHPASDDGYEGPATLTIGGSRLPVRVELRGHFQPIDGRYHWYGRVAPDDAVAAAIGGGKAAELSTPEGTAPCQVSDPDTWHRYRVTGVSAPPYASGLAEPSASPAEPSASPAEPSASPAEPAPDPAGTARAAPPLPGHVRVAIVGAGFSGLGAGARLLADGRTDFVILERAGAVGGTWRDNSYPGCACDVPSHLYSFSFAPNPRWTRSFSRQPEIWQYLEDLADARGLRPHLRLDTEVTQARWEPERSRWRLRTSRGELTAQVLISAAGPLSEPAVPDIPGLADFPGEVFHSARWDHDADLSGRRVAVVGTGASAIQIVPQIQPQAGRLVLFQRTPAWVLPRRDRRISAAERWLYRHVPVTQRAARLGIYLFRESAVPGFVWRPALLLALQRVARQHLERSVPDPELRARLTPSYVTGCKRILLSNDFYPALTRPNTEVVASGLAKIDGKLLTAQDGSTHEADAIVFATGFRVTEPPIAARVYDAGGRSLAQAWRSDMRALRGTTVTGFPNLCLLAGPNTGLGHTSMIHMIESQLNYVLDYLATLDRTGAGALDARPAAQDRWCAGVEQRMAGTVWSTGGCVSWYLNAAGRIPTLWPGSTLRFRRLSRRLDLAEYQLIPAGASA